MTWPASERFSSQPPPPTPPFPEAFREEHAAVPLAPMPLGDALARAGAFDGHEVVAIALQLLDQLAPHGDEPAGRFPGVERIALSPTGFLLTQLESERKVPFAGLGLLLQHLLSQTTAAAPALRLLVMQTAARRPTLSFHDLVRELRKWEEGPRLEVLAALYKRASERPVAAAKPAPRVEPPVLDDDASDDNGFHWHLSPGIIATLAFSAGAFLLGGLLLFQGDPGELPRAPAPPSLNIEASLAIPGAAADLPGEMNAVERPQPPLPATDPSPRPASVLNASASLPTSAAAARRDAALRSEVAAASAPPHAAPIVPRAETPRYPEAVLRAAEEEFQVARALFEQKRFDSAASKFEEVVAILDRGDSIFGLRSIAAEFADASDALARRSSGEALRVYTTIDEGVTEPVALTTLPPQATVRTPPDRRAVLELLIDAQGKVESAHLIDADQHYRDRWLTSAAKSWLFQPATKDGHPVRFLKRLTFVDGQAFGPS